jgi:hypothetical protein
MLKGDLRFCARRWQFHKRITANSSGTLTRNISIDHRKFPVKRTAGTVARKECHLADEFSPS